MLKGAVVKVEWQNPHIWLYLDAKDESGKTVRWQCEGGPPNTLTRNGWTKDALKEGDQITIDGFRAKDGTQHLQRPLGDAARRAKRSSPVPPKTPQGDSRIVFQEI